MDKETLGIFLAKLREEKNLKQEAVAEMLDINYKTVSKWEHGYSAPDTITLMKLAEIYNVSLYELTIGKKIKNPLISKNNIRKIINKNSIKKIIILKIILIILSIFFLIGTIFSIAYTTTNYSIVKVYDLKGSDNNLYVNGVFIKMNSSYHLSINNIIYDNNIEAFLKNKTNKVNYSLTIDTYQTKYRELNFESQTKIKDALPMIRFNIYDKLTNKNINHFFLNINYRNEKNEEVNKSFKIILDKKFSNTKLKY